jgi:hypothetical protein
MPNVGIRTMEKWRKNWAEKKTNIALRLNGGECSGSYGEAVIILCTVLSAFAAEVWPGERKDRARFVELLKEFAPLKYKVTRISIPLLIAYLKDNQRTKESEVIRDSFLKGDPSLVLTGDDIDRSETEIMMLCNTLEIKDLRYHSYANLLYTEVRSGYAHEYKTGKLTDPWPMTKKESFISYVNWACKPDRHIHFHVSGIAKLVLSIAEAIDTIGTTLPRNDPQNWWIYGKI